MKNNISRTGAYIGAGIGLTIFALAGLLYGSFLGGVVGLQLSGQLFGTGLEFGVLPRIILALGIMVGVLLAAVVCVAGSALIGYFMGLVVELFHIGTLPLASQNTAAK